MPNPAPPAAAIAAVLARSTQVTRRLEIYEYDGSTLWSAIGDDSRLVSGNISIDANRDERRSLDCVLDNSDGLLRHQPEHGLWWDKIIKVWRGVKYWGVDPITSLPHLYTYEAQLGEFLIDSIDADSFPNQIKITARDLSKKMLNSKLTQSMQFAAGTKVETVIAALASNAGISKFILPITGKNVDKATVFERNAERWKIAKDLAIAAGHDLFFDATGYLILRPFRDPSTTAVEYTFETGSSGNLVKYSKSSNDSKVFNHIVITGDTANNPTTGSAGIVFVEAKNTATNSPTRIARIGDRTFPYSSPFFTSNAQAQPVANSWLKLKALEEFNMSFSSLVVPWLDVGGIVRILDPGRTEYEPTRFLLDSLGIPLSLEPMTGLGKRVTIVGETGVTI